MFQVNITPDYFQSNDFEDPGVLELKSTWLAFVIISGILFGIALLIFVALRQRIQLAIGLIKEGAKASHYFLLIDDRGKCYIISSSYHRSCLPDLC